jgi:hypothetical protein
MVWKPVVCSILALLLHHALRCCNDHTNSGCVAQSLAAADWLLPQQLLQVISTAPDCPAPSCRIATHRTPEELALFTEMDTQAEGRVEVMGPGEVPEFVEQQAEQQQEEEEGQEEEEEMEGGGCWG